MILADQTTDALLTELSNRFDDYPAKILSDLVFVIRGNLSSMELHERRITEEEATV